MKLAVISGFLAILAVQYAQAITIENCIKLAITKGVPVLGIPSHNPLVIPGSNTFQLPNFLGSTLNLTVSKFKWTNIPDYRITKHIVTKNATDHIEVEGEIVWDEFTVSFDYDLKFADSVFRGNIEYLFKNVAWSGNYIVTKPDDQGIRKIENLVIKQTDVTRTVLTTGFGFSSLIAENLLLALYDIFAEIHINTANLVGKGFEAKINKYWYGNPDTLNTLVKWCDAQDS